ncbi:MAG: N-acetyltransferase [Solirubrobacterales bacterium]|nr:N-acetyltransferase [Solirubrobacterales bacterium]
MDTTVRDNPDENRYELHVDGELAGFARYRRQDGVVNLFHTEVDGAHEGTGVGGRLARETLDDLRARGEAVRPDCPFIAGWIEHHPEYRDLVRPSAAQGLA